MRRIILVASLALALIVAAAPVAAADSIQFKAEGTWAQATFTNVSFEGEQIPPGDYFYTEVWASRSITTGEYTYEDSGVCVFSQTFSIDVDGNWIDGTYIGGCGPASLSFERRLSGAHVTASLPIEDCVAWDDTTKECLEWATVASLDVDLTWTGIGALYRYHGVGSGGTAGIYQYVQHGTGSGREAVATGDVTYTLDGTALDLTGGIEGHGFLQESRDGYVEVVVKG